MIGNNWIALVLTFVLALAWLRLNDFLAHRGIISSPLSRKIIHIGTGPIFVLCWLFFTPAVESRWLAALVPFAITVQFALIGLGLWKDPAAVAGMARTGDPKEILRGPLFYGIVFVVLTLVFWNDSLIGIVALMLLCGGDGLADVVGKRVKTPALPWSPRKSIGGTLAVFAGGIILTALVLGGYALAGALPGGMPVPWLAIGVVILAGTLVESLPFHDIDNLTVPAVAVLMGYFLY
jgi:phytol kinase